MSELYESVQDMRHHLARHPLREYVGRQRKHSLETKYKLTVRDNKGLHVDALANELEKGIQKAADLCKVSPPVCRGNLGISRSIMPQLDGDVVPKFIESLEKKGIRVQRTSIPVGKLMATQKELDAHKVLGMARAVRSGKLNLQKGRLIVSQQNHILDGHHRWAALLVLDPGNKLKVWKVGMKTKDLVKAANSFEGVAQRAFGR